MIKISPSGELIDTNKEFGGVVKAAYVEANTPILGGRTSREAKRSIIVRKKEAMQKARMAQAKHAAAKAADKASIDSLRKEIIAFKAKKRNDVLAQNKRAKQILTAKRGKYADIPLAGNEFSDFRTRGELVCDKNLKGDYMGFGIGDVEAFGSNMSMSGLEDSNLGKGFKIKRPSAPKIVRRVAAPIKKVAAVKKVASVAKKSVAAPKAISKAGLKVTPAPLKAAAAIAASPVIAASKIPPKPTDVLKNPKSALSVKKAMGRVKTAAKSQLNAAKKVGSLASKLNLLKGQGAPQEEIEATEQEVIVAEQEANQAATETTAAAVEQKVEEQKVTKEASQQVAAGNTTFKETPSVKEQFTHPLVNL
jgi:hypothetical protein